MGEGIEITSGGAISVDSGELREVGDRLAFLAARLREVGDVIRQAHATLLQAPSATGAMAGFGIWGCADRVTTLAAEAEDDADGTRLMADVYELVELRARQAALQVHHPALAAALQPRIDDLVASGDQVEKMATQLVAGWEAERFEGLGDLPVGGVLGPLLFGFGGQRLSTAMTPVVGGLAARGVIPYGARLGGTAPPVAITRTASATVATPPRGITGALQRIPKSGSAQIRVEKYTFADGSRQFIAYVDGTRHWGSGSREPWDMGSNWDLYMDQEQAASSEATLMALEDAGAEPGDIVDSVTYSQAGMVGSHLAMGETYENDLVITVGSPAEPSLDADQTLVQLRHTDDPVGSALTGGGSFGGTGSPDSFTVTREASTGALDVPVTAHLFDAYLETAEQADLSGDPRVAKVDEHWARLGEAVSIESTDYAARRP